MVGEVHVGPKGGKFYISASGRKVYLKAGRGKRGKGFFDNLVKKGTSLIETGKKIKQAYDKYRPQVEESLATAKSLYDNRKNLGVGDLKNLVTYAKSEYDTYKNIGKDVLAGLKNKGTGVGKRKKSARQQGVELGRKMMKGKITRSAANKKMVSMHKKGGAAFNNFLQGVGSIVPLT